MVVGETSPPAALLNSSSESSIEPVVGGAGIVMCTQLSASSTGAVSVGTRSATPPRRVAQLFI